MDPNNAILQPKQNPGVVGLRVPKGLPVALYLLLVLSAGLALFGQNVPFLRPAFVQAAPWVFLVFIAGFASYRMALVMAGQYPAFKAFWQTLVAVLFFMLLLRGVAARKPSLLEHSDPRVRAIAAKMCLYEPTDACANALPRLRFDSDEAVRAAAASALSAQPKP